MKKLLQLFWEMFRISLFVVGGGYAIIVVADSVFAKLGWIEEGELLDHLPVFQMIPGIIAAHTAIYVGRKVGGKRGAAVSLFAVALPSIVLFSFVSAGFDAIPQDNAWLESAFVGLRAALTGVIAATIVRGWRRNLPDAFAYALATAALASLVFRVPVWIVLVAAMAAGLVLTFATAGREGTARTDRATRAARWSAPTGGDDACGGNGLKFRTPSWLAILLFLKYGSLCFGGGFVLVPMYLEDFVGATAPFLQVSEGDFSNLMALTQMTPGPISINAATYFGYRTAGLVGALLASLALLLPGSCLSYAALTSMERFRTSRIVRGILRGARPASVALMLVALFAFARLCVIHPDGSFGLTALLLVILATLTTMKKKLSPMILVLVCTLAATLLRADDTLTRERYPDADSVTVNVDERVKYRPDGTYDETEETWTKILTEKGRREESVISLSYSKRYGTAEIEFVRAIGTNGVERTIDVTATTSEQTDNSSMGSNIYDPLDRVITCTIPGLKVGETVHHKVRRIALEPRCEGVWADLSIFEWTSPIVRSSYEITAPAERPLRRVAIRHPLGNIVTSVRTNADASVVHTFVSTNSPQVFPEPDSPALYTEVQNVRVSTASDWPEISRWYWRLSEPHLAKTNAAMVAKVKEIVAKAGAKEDARMRAIFKFVSQEVRYMGLTMEDASPGYAPHDVNITFDNRYGVCRDKAGLLVAMLRLADIEAYPVLINVGPKQDPEVPQPFFNHAIVAVVPKTSPSSAPLASPSYVLMDPTNENANDLLPAYESDKSFLVARPEGEKLMTTPTPSPEHNLFAVDSRGTLAKDGSLFLESELRFDGINDTLYRGFFAKKTNEERAKFFERLVRAFSPNANLVRCEVEPRDMRDTAKSVRVSLAAELPEMTIDGETRDTLTVPFISRRIGLANFLLSGSTSLDKRRFPLQLDSTACVDERIRIDVDGQWPRVRDLPSPLELKGGYDFTKSFSFTNGTLSAHRRMAVSKLTFSPEDYLRLRTDIQTVEAAERQHPVLARDPNAEADTRCRDAETEVDVASDTAWTVTNRVVREVLTYQGKRSSAEVKISFNPSVERIGVLSATVSNRDGRVTAVSSRELNVMDCSWAASAPRYPKSRLLVINLPGVEIGSVIDMTTVRVVTNAPTAYYDMFFFDTYDPIDRRFVRVNDWKREVRAEKRLPNEPGQPAPSLWRDAVLFAPASFAEAARPLAAAAEVPSEVADAPVIEGSEDRVRAIRDWMSRNVKVAGPALWEVPIRLQLTPPETVLRERYASRLDYVRTLAALLRSEGFDADVVFAADDARDPEEIRRRDRGEKPNVRAFALPLCRVRVKTGGFLGLFADETTYFLGTESEYAPLGVCGLTGATFYDPSEESFGTVTVPEERFADSSAETREIDVRENGGVDMTVVSTTSGSGVGEFRKRFAEILPEDRSRLYQSLLGAIAQAATATSDLETDTKGYPAMQKFSCFIPNFATVADGAITLQLRDLLSSIPSFTGRTRRTPFAVGAREDESERVTVRFPEGYTAIDHLPESFSFSAPDDPSVTWLVSKVSTRTADGRLEVVLERRSFAHPYGWYRPDMIELVRNRSRIAASAANHTIVVRRLP